jgi:hypothetical protein
MALFAAGCCSRCGSLLRNLQQAPLLVLLLTLLMPILCCCCHAAWNGAVVQQERQLLLQGYCLWGRCAYWEPNNDLPWHIWHMVVVGAVLPCISTTAMLLPWLACRSCCAGWQGGQCCGVEALSLLRLPLLHGLLLLSVLPVLCRGGTCRCCCCLTSLAHGCPEGGVVGCQHPATGNSTKKAPVSRGSSVKLVLVMLQHALLMPLCTAAHHPLRVSSCTAVHDSCCCFTHKHSTTNPPSPP